MERDFDVGQFFLLAVVHEVGHNTPHYSLEKYNYACTIYSHVQCIIHPYNHVTYMHACHCACTMYASWKVSIPFVILSPCYCLFSVCGFHVINFEVSHIKGSDIILSFYTFFSFFRNNGRSIQVVLIFQY